MGNYRYRSLFEGFYIPYRSLMELPTSLAAAPVNYSLGLRSAALSQGVVVSV